VSGLSRAVIILLSIATIFFGVYPQPILHAIKPQRESVALRSTSLR
jgi:NADH:ubiquinone oxidoreductase subunit 4 (subunit M)